MKREIRAVCWGSRATSLPGLPALCAKARTERDPRAIEKERHMNVHLTIEASQPSGKTFRLGFGCHVHLAWVLLSVVLKGRRREPFFFQGANINNFRESRFPSAFLVIMANLDFSYARISSV